MRRESSLLEWARQYLEHYFPQAGSGFHEELARDLCDPAKRLLARVAPRGHAKSTLASIALPLWCICENRAKNIAIITHEGGLATQFVRDIRHELEGNEKIIESYGDLCGLTAPAPDRKSSKRPPAPTVREGPPPPAPPRKPRRSKWTEQKFTTANGVTVQARGSGAGFRGARVGPNRPDLIICDDIEHDQQVRSADGRRKLEQWLRRVVMPALAPGGRLIVVGSLLHYDSLLANLRDRQRFPGWDYHAYRALEAQALPPGPVNPAGNPNFELVALWPARWPVERLKEERGRIGTLAFEQEYQANPIDEALRAFRPEWLRRYRESDLVPERLVTVMAVDPATGAGSGDFFALWVGSIDVATGIIYTRELLLERVGIVDQVRLITSAFQRWRPVRIGIEVTAYQVALKQILDEHSRASGLYMPVVGLKTTTNKLARIEGSAPFYENGTFRLPAELSAEAETQFLQFPKAKHDDAPDVCAMGIEVARSMRSGAHLEGAVLQNGNLFARRDIW